jgi:ribosomal protein L22
MMMIMMMMNGKLILDLLRGKELELSKSLIPQSQKNKKPEPSARKNEENTKEAATKSSVSS